MDEELGVQDQASDGARHLLHDVMKPDFMRLTTSSTPHEGRSSFWRKVMECFCLCRLLACRRWGLIGLHNILCRVTLSHLNAEHCETYQVVGYRQVVPTCDHGVVALGHGTVPEKVRLVVLVAAPQHRSSVLFGLQNPARCHSRWFSYWNLRWGWLLDERHLKNI